MCSDSACIAPTLQVFYPQLFIYISLHLRNHPLCESVESGTNRAAARRRLSGSAVTFSTWHLSQQLVLNGEAGLEKRRHAFIRSDAGTIWE